MNKSEQIYKLLKDSGFEDSDIEKFSQEYMELFLQALLKNRQFIDSRLDKQLYPYSLRYEDKNSGQTYVLKESKIWQEKV